MNAIFKTTFSLFYFISNIKFLKLIIVMSSLPTRCISASKYSTGVGRQEPLLSTHRGPTLTPASAAVLYSRFCQGLTAATWLPVPLATGVKHNASFGPEIPKRVYSTSTGGGRPMAASDITKSTCLP
ncbi:UNVERIFIED_CONTAM: hypothetical protein K2H54_058997 [Gekko kuhli]